MMEKSSEKTVFKFKSRKKKSKGKIRKRSVVNEESDGDEEIRSTLEELRQEQGLRKRFGGIQAEVPKNEKKQENEEEDEVGVVGQDVEYGLKDKKQAKKDLEKLMEGQFTGQVASKDKQEEIHEKLLDDYINEKMGIKKPTEKEENPKEPDEEDKLYVLPSELKPKSMVQDYETGDSGAGAPIAYNTGIAEVNLPMEFKLKNIEATEKLRQQLQLTGDAEVDTRPAWMREALEAPGNITANYAAHRAQWMENLRLKQKLERKGQDSRTPYQQSSGPRGKFASSDDKVLERFKKRARGKR